MSYVPNSTQDKAEMLAALGNKSSEELFANIPAKVRLKKQPELPAPLSEPELLEELKSQSGKNRAFNFLGAGSYKHFIPSAVKHIVSRSEFYTAYTPYQAEASQGTLQAIYEYQTMLCSLTGMDVANASMYDGATALTEAAFLACRATKRKEILVSSAVHPEYRNVLKTYAKAAGFIVKEFSFDKNTGQTILPQSLTANSSCLILAQPNFFGCLEDISGVAEKVHANGSLFIVSIDPISLGLLKAPGDYGADIVTGEGQTLGNPVSFGGPGLGIFAAKKALIRQVPGRIVGQTIDVDGKRGFCLTLQAREQHIRRERAFSNICSNEALAALAATAYLSLMGKQGLRKVAELCLQKTAYAKKLLGSSVLFANTPAFKEIVIKTDKNIGFDLSAAYPELAGHRLVFINELVKNAALAKLAQSLA
ncbi:MAG: aminomethyl-transferring glycine dehydrogenase subunit GcvPA [Candidatus Margulisbacteria bacterium]|nr:aminomethyl-transferring glycine dehydrogenase subunit GcvPA [Candidatus Margulisiibacteriota bacterium]